MSDVQPTTVTGEVTDIFAHRFVVQTAAGRVLADLGPKGAEHVRLSVGKRVTLTGEMKPSELKVSQYTAAGDQPIAIDHAKKPKEDETHEEVDPAPALRTAEANGFTVVGKPRRKPRHFELLGRDAGGDFVELHVELDGTLRKTKGVEAHDPKWADELTSNG